MSCGCVDKGVCCCCHECFNVPLLWCLCCRLWKRHVADLLSFGCEGTKAWVKAGRSRIGSSAGKATSWRARPKLFKNRWGALGRSHAWAQALACLGSALIVLRGPTSLCLHGLGSATQFGLYHRKSHTGPTTSRVGMDRLSCIRSPARLSMSESGSRIS